MRLSILLAFSVACLFVNGQENRPISVKSTVNDVKLYLAGAQVKRSLSINLPKGTTTIVVKNLPNTFDASTLTVEGKGDFTILSIMEQWADSQPSIPAEAKILQDSLTLLISKKDEAEAMQSVLDEEEKFLNQNRAIGGQQAGIKAADLREASDFFRLRMERIKKEKLSNRNSIAQLNKDIERVKAKLYPFSSSRLQLNQELAITILAERPISAKMNISYYTSSAHWVPTYDIRSKGYGEPVDLILKASTYNATGESWENVNLSFSTGRPTEGSTPPMLTTWFLRPIAPPPPPAPVSYRKMATPEMAVQGAVLDEYTHTTSAEITIRQDAMVTTEYAIPLAYSVATGKDPLIVEINRQSLTANYEYIVTPKLSQKAYLVARIGNTDNISLLSAKASIFLEGTYTGAANLNAAMTTDSLMLPLGIDDAIQVERLRVKDFKARRFLGSKVTESVGWDITVRNNKRKSIIITVNDQIPVATDRNIQVTVETISGGNLNPDNGFINWKLNLDANDSKKLRFSYNVEFPKDMKIILE
jgi:uncharacterized protein (TIGR02231 family)